MRVNKIAKMVVGADNMAAEDIDFDNASECAVVPARLQKRYSCACGV